MRNLTMALVFCCTLALALPSAQGSTITLSIQASGGIWNAYASCSNDCAGLSSFIINVTGTNGFTVASSLMKAPKGVDTDLGAMFGFANFSNGASGIGIRGGQPTMYEGGNDPILDSLVLQDVGITAGGPYYSVSWDAPVRLATGTYTGTAGTLQVNVGNGQFNVLDDMGSGWTGPGNVSMADTVIGGSTTIPEPATLCLLAMGCAMLARRRRAA